MDLNYPPGPAAVPPDLTEPTSAYKRHAWLAMLGLAVFIALYFALSAWFAWTAWRLFGGMFADGGDIGLWGFVVALCSAFLAVFMLKALFFIQHRYEIEDLEITRAEEPRLFEFIDRLADEARAPRAHKVYLSPRVNAAVFYDLSLLNLVIPSKKNLEIGLGLVNVLPLGELKAVLAHEFGHFAQRSMAVGRWVYIAQQIAGHVVARRDALDKLLQQLSRFDLRVAWIGWVLSMIVWSIRSMMDVLFRAVLLAQRALSRQMEFQADLVAVSLTGSDALIHALHRLNAADDAWAKTLSFANTEAGKNRGVADLFAVQSRIIERMREILNQPTYGALPPMPQDSPQAHRVFKSELAQPPRMWLTHPPSADREHNAKQRYVVAPVDERSAWELFSDPQALKERMSAHIFRKAEKLEATPKAATLEQLDREYGRAFLDRRYRGIYLGRSPVRHVMTAAELYGPSLGAEDVVAALDTLYPESLAGRVEQLNEKLEQKYALEALRDQVAQAPGGVIRHNGEEIRRRDLPRVIAVLEREIAEMRDAVQAHDRACRTAHISAAQTLEKGWPEYLRGLAAVLHYADHSEANLRDAQGYLSNIYNVVTADGRVSSDEMIRLVAGCQELYRPLQAVYAQAAELSLDRTLLRRLEVENWPAMLEEFKLTAPTRENLSNWFSVIDSWIGASLYALSRLRVATLEQLLLAEGQVARFVRDRMPSADAPPASSVPIHYDRLLPGTERKRQKRLDWWDRFQTADGVVPMLARSAVAIGIVGSVIALGGHVGVSSLTIYNGLALPVWVEVADQKIAASPFTPVTVDIPPSGNLKVRALTADQREIESFEELSHGAGVTYFYNVAGATPLLQWTVRYYSSNYEARNSPAPVERPQGAPRWARSRVDYLFVDPPQSIELKNGVNASREVMAAARNGTPSQQAEMVQDKQERERLVMAHARWDTTSSPDISDWLQLASQQAGFDAMFAQRLKQDAEDVMLLRFAQDNTQGEKHAAVCARQRAQSAAAPGNPNLLYLAIRCLADDAQQDAEFLAAQKKWPDNPWMALAAGFTHARSGEYAAAAPFYDQAQKQLPGMGDYLAVATARVRRLADGRSLDNMHDLLRASSRLQFYAQIESGNDVANTPLEPFTLLARGQLDEAVKATAKYPETAQQVVPLAAASDGSSKEIIDQAMALETNDTTATANLFMLYGTAVKAHRDSARYAALLAAQLGPDGAPMLQFWESIRRGGDPLAALRSMPPLEIGARMHALNVAVVMLGARAPRAWREDVSRGLFIGERGYIGPVRAAPADLPARQPENQQRPGDSHPARILSSPVG